MIETAEGVYSMRKLDREELLKLIGSYCKNWLAMDGLWFQSVGQKHGMDEAMELTSNICSVYYGHIAMAPNKDRPLG